jgi:hypothetical protein
MIHLVHCDYYNILYLMKLHCISAELCRLTHQCKYYFQQKLLFSLSLHLISSYIRVCLINVLHNFITDTITLLCHQWTTNSSLSYFSHPCDLPITSAGKFYCGFISSFKDFILYLSQLIIFYSTFTYFKNVS